MTPSATLILLIFLSVDAIALLILLAFHIRKEWKRSKVRHFGDRAEKEVSDYIKEQFPGAVLLNNVFLKTERSVTQIDHILLCKWGIFVIETKSHNGKINIGKKEWVQIYGEKVIRFHSPLLQNEVHRQALLRVLKKSRLFRKTPVKGIVVFTSKKVLFSRLEDGILRLEEMGPYIKSGGKTRKARGVMTAKPGTSYLSRANILSLEKCIRRNCVRSRRRKKHHERSLRHLDRNGYE